MNSQGNVCRLCSNSDQEKNLENIDENIQEMLQALLISIDISPSENSVICKTCHNKLENNYNFKKKCLFTEDTLSPFVAKNVKINLNEIQNQIVKPEVEVEKNICRLCLQYSDDDMTLSEEENRQFQKLFPEMNLNLTNFVVLCSTCYNTLQKYFVFVMLCPSSEEPLYEYPLDNNSEQNVVTKSEDKIIAEIADVRMNIKCEEDSKDFFDNQSCSSSMDLRLGLINDIKSVDTVMNTEEYDDDKKLTLNEELDIKSDEDSTENGCFYSNLGNAKTSFKLQQGGLSFDNLEGSVFDKIDSTKFSKEDCSSLEKNANVFVNADPSKIQMYKCEECNFRSKYEGNLKSHFVLQHTDPSKTKIRKCDKCDYQFNWPSDLKRHILCKHTDLSKIPIYECQQCSFKSKHEGNVKSHILFRHTDPSKTKMHKCDICDYQFKLPSHLKRHIRDKHTDPSKIQKYHCKECDHKSKEKWSLMRHILFYHTDPSKVEMYKCAECDYVTKHKSNLKSHILFRHTDPSKANKHKCDECDYQCKTRSNLKHHILLMHSDPFKVLMYQCEECDYKSRQRAHLKQHFLSRHGVPSKI